MLCVQAIGAGGTWDGVSVGAWSCAARHNVVRVGCELGCFGRDLREPGDDLASLLNSTHSVSMPSKCRPHR